VPIHAHSGSLFRSTVKRSRVVSAKQRTQSGSSKRSRLAYWLGRELWQSACGLLCLALLLPSCLPPALLAAGAQSITLQGSTNNRLHVWLNWRIHNPGTIAQVYLYRADDTNPGSFQLLRTLSRDTTAFLDETVAPNKLYFYRVLTASPFGIFSSPSNTVSVAVGTLPPTPTLGNPAA
jgi:hypothetical protein